MRGVEEEEAAPAEAPEATEAAAMEGSLQIPVEEGIDEEDEDDAEEGVAAATSNEE
jgi:hypothetical protein